MESDFGDGGPELVLIRHAAAEAGGRLCGRTDVPAMRDGARWPRAVAPRSRRLRAAFRAPRCAAARPPPRSGIATSPSTRRLWEQDFGEWDGLPLDRSAGSRTAPAGRTRRAPAAGGRKLRRPLPPRPARPPRARLRRDRSPSSPMPAPCVLPWRWRSARPARPSPSRSHRYPSPGCAASGRRLLDRLRQLLCRHDGRPPASPATSASGCRAGSVRTGRSALVTLPCPALAVTASWRPAAALSLGGPAAALLCQPAGQRSAAGARPRPGRRRRPRRRHACGRRRRRIDRGAGRAGARRRAQSCPPEAIAAACLAAEGASDPLMLDEPDGHLWASREGRSLGHAAAAGAASRSSGVSSGRRSGPTRRTLHLPDIADLVDPWRIAAAHGDLGALARLAARSAERTTTLRGPGGRPDFKALAAACGALGHVRAHTGSARGLVFAPGTAPQGTEARLAAAGCNQRPAVPDRPAMSGAAAMLVALALDALVGWPDWLYRRIGHPVTWIGGLIGLLDTALNRAAWSGAGAPRRRRRRGAGGHRGSRPRPRRRSPPRCRRVRPGPSLAGVLAWPLVAARSLDDHVAAVARPLGGARRGGGARRRGADRRPGPGAPRRGRSRPRRAREPRRERLGRRRRAGLLGRASRPARDRRLQGDQHARIR